MKTFPSTAAILVLALVSACSEKNPTEPGKSSVAGIQTGSPVELATQTVNPAGGTIAVNKPGDPLDGLELNVPVEGFADSRTFQISSAPIQKYTLAEGLTPASPMISVQYEGGYSDSPMTLKIPAHLPAGRFAMAFFYDSDQGTLEALPSEAMDSSSVTVSTRHFQSETSGSTGKAAGFFKTADGSASKSLLLISIEESLLNRKVIIDTGFRPGNDDWEFPNGGSYLVPTGHCAGQSMTAMWYFMEIKPRDGKRLFHRFDTVSDWKRPELLWQDNPRGIRLASVVDNDMNFSNWMRRNRFLQYGFPGMTWNCLCLAMLATGEPQYVSIQESGTGPGAHALVAYKIDQSSGKLYVADPNYPANYRAGQGSVGERAIEFSGGAFRPYETPAEFLETPKTYDKVAYIAKTAYINWSKIGERWREFEQGTIGDGLYPAYTLRLEGPAGDELTDNLAVEDDSLHVVCLSPDCESYLGDTPGLQRLEVYSDAGTLLAVGGSASRGVASVKLKKGKNKLGFYVTGARPVRGEGKVCYLDFKWFNVLHQILFIEPNPLNAQPNTKVTFTARTNGTAPANARYEWDFGDHTPAVKVSNDSTVEHTFTEGGNFSVQVELFDAATGESMGTAQAEAVISTGLLGLLQAHKGFQTRLTAEFHFTPESYINFIWFGSTNNQGSKVGELTWNGTRFNADIGWERISGGDSLWVRTVVSGEASYDGTSIVQFTGRKTEVNRYSLTLDSTYMEYTLVNVPITYYELGDMFECFKQEAGISGMVQDVHFTRLTRHEDSMTHEISVNRYELTSINWDSSYPPALYLRFFRE